MAKNKPLKLADLQVNTDNYRFDPVASQKEAIDKMVEDQKEKLVDLAEHILANGLNPNDKIQVLVSNHDSTKYNVVEGNRRIVTLKLLSNPDILDGSFLSLKRKFQKLRDNNKSKILKVIDCTIYNDAKEADIWVGVKHGYGKNGIATERWDPVQKGRFEEKILGKSSIVLQTIKLLKMSSEVPTDIKSNIDKIKVTNLDRLISDPDVRDFLGIEINNGILQSSIAEKEVIKGLSHIAKDLLKPEFKVKEIYTKEDRIDYINKFPKGSTPDLKKKAKKDWQFLSSSTPVNAGKAKAKKNPKHRDKLIPKACVLKIKNPKLNAIYDELQKLNVLKFTNAVAISLRVFIENSMDFFIEENKITAKDGRPITKDDRLIRKIQEVANHLETNKLADSHICKGIRNAAQDKNDLLGIETLHAYIHNNKFSPTAQHLIISWDNIQVFIEKVWGNIK